MRKRFKQSVIASSENYNAKKTSHLLMLQQNREENKKKAIQTADGCFEKQAKQKLYYKVRHL